MTASQPSNGAGLPQPGEVIAGKYRVDRILGVGGMGVVVAAHHVRLDEKVALKFLLPEALANPEAVARFDREARAASKIKNEHVARVSDVGTLDTGSPYIVMEYLEGGDLAAWVEKRGPLPIPQAVDFVLQACEAIADAHALGIVHRDLKPANLFCIQRSDGQLCIKVLDFGISKLSTPGGEGVSMTRTTAILGSPLYMSPEQMMQSKGVDARTDIWSLGTILFELVTGHVPFDSDTVTELAIRIATMPHTEVRSFLPGTPPSFEALIAKCLQKDRNHRFQTVADFANALGEFAPPQSRLSIERVIGTLQRAGIAGAGAGVLPTGVDAGAMQVGAGTAASWGQTGSGVHSPPAAKSSTGAIIGGLAFLGIALGGVGVVFLLRHPTSPPATETAVGSSTSAATATPSAAAPEDSAAAAPSATPSATPEVATAEPSASTAATAVAAVAAIRHATGGAANPGAATPPRGPAAAHSATSAPPTGAPSKPNCNPPYVINAAGEHEYKPECLK